MLRFVTSHSAGKIGLSLLNEDGVVLLFIDMFPGQAKVLAKMLSGRGNALMQWEKMAMTVVCDNNGVLILVDTGGPYLSFKIAMTHAQADDLTSTIGLHLHAIETEGTPDSGIVPMDDRPGGWSPGGEREKYGEPADNDPADDWKRGKK